MKSKSRMKYLFKNTVIFGISAMATKIIQFFLVPLYTNALSPSDYGNVDLLFTICSFLYPLITLNIAEAVYRFSLDKDKDDNKISCISILCFLLSVVLGVIFIPVLSIFNDYKQYAVLFYVYLITLSLSQILLVTLKGREKLKLFAIGNIINVLLVAIFSILFLYVLKIGTNGYFYSYILANIITSIFALFFTNMFDQIRKFSLDKKLFINMIKYSIVLIPTSFMWWIINSSDRIMVTSMISSHANGLYSVSYKIPSILTIIATIFNQAWVFSAIVEKDSTDSSKFTNKIFKVFSSTIILMAMVLTVVIKPLYQYYVSIEYYESWRYIPFLLGGFVFMTLGTFISSTYNVHKDSKGFLFSGMAGAIANIVLNFALIPFLGVYGAAIATSISYLIVFLYRIIDTKKYLTLNIDNHFIMNILLLFLMLGLMYLNNSYIQIIILIIAIIYNYKIINDMLKNIKKD